MNPFDCEILTTEETIRRGICAIRATGGNQNAMKALIVLIATLVSAAGQTNQPATNTVRNAHQLFYMQNARAHAAVKEQENASASHAAKLRSLSSAQSRAGQNDRARATMKAAHAEEKRTSAIRKQAAALSAAKQEYELRNPGAKVWDNWWITNRPPAARRR